MISRELYTPWKKAYYRLKLDSMKKSNFEESLSPPPIKKSKVEYEDDSEGETEQWTSNSCPLNIVSLERKIE